MKRTDVPTVRFSEETFDDNALASLYRRADALILPYRGEGFGLPVLEAMACGTAPIVTSGGATDDFVTDETGYRMPAKREPVAPLSSGDVLAKPGWVLEVDRATLQRTMRYAFEHQDEVRAVGERAAAAVANGFTWAHSARKAVDRLAELSTRTPISRAGEYEPINAYEKKHYSQNGEDGILLELFARLRIADPFFVEFGTGDGTELNARLLAQTYGWKGILIEGNDGKYAQLEQTYRETPAVTTVRAIITAENIAALLAEYGAPREFDLLSVDIDGNDYYVWEALAEYRPRVAVIEFNGAYPPPQRWVMPYYPMNDWRGDDYYGASLSSMTELGKRLGYALVGVDNNMVNAFFVRRDLLEAAGFPSARPKTSSCPKRRRSVNRTATVPFNAL